MRSLAELIELEPQMLRDSFAGAAVADAFAAGLAALIARRDGLPLPAWTRSEACILGDPWFPVTGTPALGRRSPQAAWARLRLQRQLCGPEKTAERRHRRFQRRDVSCSAPGNVEPATDTGGAGWRPLLRAFKGFVGSPMIV